MCCRIKERLGIKLDGQLSATFMKCFGFARQFSRVKEIHQFRITELSEPPNKWHYNAAMAAYARAGDWTSVINFYKCVTLSFVVQVVLYARRLRHRLK